MVFLSLCYSFDSLLHILFKFLMFLFFFLFLFVLVVNLSVYFVSIFQFIFHMSSIISLRFFSFDNLFFSSQFYLFIFVHKLAIVLWSDIFLRKYKKIVKKRCLN